MSLDIRIAGRYRLGRKIGGGSFGDIYLGARPLARRAFACPCARAGRPAAAPIPRGRATGRGARPWPPAGRPAPPAPIPAEPQGPDVAGTNIQTGEEVAIKLVRAAPRRPRPRPPQPLRQRPRSPRRRA
jgi:hypothetical protein